MVVLPARVSGLGPVMWMLEGCLCVLVKMCTAKRVCRCLLHISWQGTLFHVVRGSVQAPFALPSVEVSLENAVPKYIGAPGCFMVLVSVCLFMHLGLLVDTMNRPCFSL